MKFACYLGVLLCCFTSTLRAQDVTGIWRGYFYSGYGIYKQQFKYEVQINQLGGKGGPGGAVTIKGVTYSYRMASFYGKARLVGFYNRQNKEITLKEDTLLEVKMDGSGFSCLMTCYLEYHKMGDQEVLEGSFSSVITKSGADCGSGTVYLERVVESDFHKEDFLLKKKPKVDDQARVTKKPAAPKPGSSATAKQKTTPPQKPAPPAVKTAPKKDPPVVTTPPAKKPAPIVKNTPKKPAPTTKPVTKPVQPPPARVDTVVKTNPVLPPVVTQPTEPPIQKPVLPIPDVIKERENPLVRTIVTSSPDILIELYDNGEIDGDTITVYHNNQVVAFKKGLSTKPITINIKANPDDAHHEFVMVANNLGSIPPNTALMVVRTGGKRYELFIASNEEKNAKVVIDYKESQ